MKQCGIDCQDVFPEVCLEKAAGNEEKIKLVLKNNRICEFSQAEIWHLDALEDNHPKECTRNNKIGYEISNLLS